MMSAASQDAYRRTWESWNALGGPSYPNEKVVQYTFRNYPPQARAATRALDLGCGSGINTWFLAREGFRVGATDIALTGLRNTQRRLQADGLAAALARADAVHQPFADASFDYLLCVRVLELLPTAGLQDALVGECARVLRPGGRGLALFASPLDYGFVHPQMGVAPFFPPDRQRVEAMFGPRFQRVDVDLYRTTYEGGRYAEDNFLVTFVR
jgi:ubiquinone/menaquinone biosynthesis C-methylase UbiE